jgi:PAS domain S-box-containing protein
MADRLLPQRARPVLVTAALLAAVALGAGGLQWKLSRSVQEANGLAHAHVLEAEALLSALKDVETSQRGFVLTGDDTYLAPYQEAVRAVDRLLPGLEQDGLPVGRLRPMVTDKLAWAARVIAIRRAEGLPAASRAIESGQGKTLMDGLRHEVASIQAEARSAVARRGAAETRRANLLGAAALAALLLSGVALGLYALARRRAEKRATALLDGVMMHAPVGLGFLDRRLRLGHANNSLAMLGEKFLAGGVWPEDVRAQMEPRLAEVLRTGRAQTDVAVEVPAAPGRSARQLQMSLFPLGDFAEGVGIAAIDVTARHRIEARLRRSEARLRMTVDSVPQLAWMTDAEGEIQWYNRRWYDFTGGSPESMKGSGWQQVHHPDHLERVTEHFRAAIAAGEAWEDTFPLRGADGRYRWFLSRALPMRDLPDTDEPDGRLIGWFGTNTDITEMREAEEALEAAKAAAEDANMAKSQFIANMSHELRTPLSAVIGYSEMLEEEAEDLEGGEAFREDLGKINSNARHLLSLINDVLDLSKIEAGKMEVQPEDFALSPLVAEVAETVGALVAKKGNALEVSIATDLPPAHSDPVKIRQCLFNLLGNAAKFTEGGRITLSAAPDAEHAGWVVLRVSDTGIGMTGEQLERLFQRFSQADATTTRRFGGTGLGLAITKAFCTMLGGRIAVESEVGKGTSFTLRLPADLRQARTEPDEPAVLAAEASVDPAPAERHAGLVLVIDDDAATRDLLMRFLTREGFTVRAAPDGQTGLAMARELRPDAILLDVMMPRLDGWGVLAAIKAEPELADTPVVMVTVVQERGLAFSLGAADYLNKPVEWSHLKRVLDRYRVQPSPGLALVVEQDEDQCAALRVLLRKEGWAVEDVAERRAALARMATPPAPDMLLVEVQGGDGGDGLALIRELRTRPEWASLPIIALTADVMTEAGLETLRGKVHGVMAAEDGIPEELTRELRRIASARRKDY